MVKWLCLILCLISKFTYSCELKLRVPMSSRPPAFVYENNTWSGYSISMVDLLLRNAGCSYSIKKLPFKRAIMYLKNGKIDMLMHVSKFESREKSFHFVGPQYYEYVVLVVSKKSKLDIKSYDDFSQLSRSIAIERGFSYGSSFEKLMSSNKGLKEKIIEVSSFQQMREMLLRGRIDGFLYNIFSYRSDNSKIRDLKAFKIHPFILTKTANYFAFSKVTVNKELLDRLKRAYQTSSKDPLFINALSQN